MKLSVLKLSACLLLLGSAAAHSQTLNWGSETESAIMDSEGTGLGAPELGETFLFELGAFTQGFIPDETNMAQWLDNWHVFDSTTLFTNEDGSAQFSSTRTIQDYDATAQPGSEYQSMFEGLKGYIWVRNTENTEYFLASADTWTFQQKDPNCCSNTPPVTWSITDVDTPVWGGSGYISPENPYIQTQAVPELSSAFLAFLATGMFALRRRRPQGN
ncbi:MAG: hypothetical protein EOP85_02075 [Verrucomicrobiaceae bacterium]|nr:MAG: hypothetical protein EOP85_02075 [Verrucomicrobiaceae bacterium]